ncbi:hypothetical protein CL652_00835 [bacterium]|nr:hypothetical protein [bacterium]
MRLEDSMNGFSDARAVWKRICEESPFMAIFSVLALLVSVGLGAYTIATVESPRRTSPSLEARK